MFQLKHTLKIPISPSFLLMRYAKNTARKRVQKLKEIDPGVRHQLKGLNEDVLTSNDVETVDFDELEADFSQLNISHREHENQVSLMKEQEKYYIVRQKYFKEKYPNFLTWSDKLQIRQLHKEDPEEWNVEKLSEGFPALPDIIKKIVKSNWVKKNENKIKAHDAGVIKNWELFKQGKRDDLPPYLIEHLNKFSNRAIISNYDVPQNNEHVTRKELSAGEFSEIITSYQQIKSNGALLSAPGDNSCKIEKKPRKGTYLMEDSSNFGNTKSMTLNTYAKHLEDRLSTEELNEEQKHMLITLNTDEHKESNDVTVENSFEQHTSIIKHKVEPLSSLVPTKRDYSHLKYPEQIRIPKNKFRKGYTYKLNDCFYDCDGEFLYRVPGID